MKYAKLGDCQVGEIVVFDGDGEHCKITAIDEDNDVISVGHPDLGIVGPMSSTSFSDSYVTLKEWNK